ARIAVNSSGATLTDYTSGYLPSTAHTQFDRASGLLYYYGGAYDPAMLTMAGSFNLPTTGTEACTADSSLGRYYCATTFFAGGIDVSIVELWVFDLHSYALLNRVYFGASAGSSVSPVSGGPVRLVRWGKAGLALMTATVAYEGSGGVFLIDGSAVNPGATPDVTSGSSAVGYAWLSSLTPDVATNTTGEVQVTLRGNGFSPDSTACWNCNFLQFRYLPTKYVSATQLNVTIPLASVSAAEPMEISVFDPSSNLFSSNALTFTVLPAAGTTQITPVNLCGLAMAWDESSKLLYVSTADYDGAYPNSLVALDPGTGSVVKSRTVGPDPTFLTESANGEYLYLTFNGTTNLMQLSLPDLGLTGNTPLKNYTGGTLFAGDLKAAPQDPHTVAATLIVPGYHPEADGGVVVYDDGKPRPKQMPGWAGGQTVLAIYDTLAWSASDQLLTSA